MSRARLSRTAWLQQPPVAARPARAPQLPPGKPPLLLRAGHSHARRGARRYIWWLLLLLAGHHAVAEDQLDVWLSGKSGAENQRRLSLKGQAIDEQEVAPLRRLWLNSAFGLASRIGGGSSILTIKYVNYTGSVTFYGSLGSNDNLDPWSSGKALLNLMSYDRDLNFQLGSSPRTLEQRNDFHKLQPTNFQALMNSECQRDLWSSNLTDGLTTKFDSRDRIGLVDTSKYLSFSGDTKDKTITVTRSGVVAICYCAALTSANLCADPTNWYYAGRLTVRGPVGGQSWVFPTQIIVKLDVQGWGFSASDKLRIIPATGSCVSSSGNPSGDISFKVGCPARPGGGCRYATTTESIQLSLQTASASQVYISGITTGEQQSILSFSASVQNVLDSNDVITLDADRIKVDGKSLMFMSSAQKYEAYKLAAERPFSDDETKKYIVGLRVNQVMDSSTGLVDHQKLAVPVGWPSTGGPVFTFVSSKGHWTRTNKEESSENMKGMTAQKGLKVCWGVETSGNTRYYAEAGQITFRDPPLMKDARINLCTKMDAAEAPIVISLTTGPQRFEYTRSRVATTQLMLRFLDVDGKLQLRKAGDTPPSGSGPELFGDFDEVLETDKKQMECGRLFIDLWSSDPEGFPMPAGCFYSKKYKDNVEAGRPTEASYREIFISFPAGSGLKQNAMYQLVMNAKTTGISAGDILLDMYAMCTGLTGCDQPYQVFEKGLGQASMSTESRADYLDPSFATENAFQLQLGDETNSVLNLAEQNVLQIKLKGGEDTRAITANCLVRVYLWPLTLWSISPGLCSAECIKHSGSDDKKCEGMVGCFPEEVVVGSDRRNIVKLQLPTVMDAITGTVMHTIKVTELQLPVGGYFPSRVGAQLTRPDDTKPSYTTSVGFLMKDAETGSTSGRLVVAGRSGYGPKPFPNDKLNIFYLRLSFGATVRSVDSPSASFSVVLPAGYTCSVPDDGLADYNGLDIFSSDANNDGYYDNSRGYLSVAAEDGSWPSAGSGTCTYTLSKYNAIFAGMVFYVKVTVDNPGEAMRKTNVNNTWQIQLRGTGVLTGGGDTQLYNTLAVPFISLAEEKLLGAQSWGGNAAVLSPLDYETLQPTQLRISSASEAQTGDLRVFFKTTQYVGQQGYVLLDAPVGFDFGANCLAGSLSSDYYAFHGTSEEQLKPLRDISECVGLRYPSSSQTYNRARIKVNGIIDAGQIYGFKINVTNPTFYDKQQHLDWYIWTEDSDMYGIEGSTSTVKFNPTQSALQLSYYHKAFGTYQGKFFDNFNIHVADMTPKSISSADTVVSVWPLVFQSYLLTSLRITAPQGFVWVVGDAFKATLNMTTADFPEAPVVENGNQLVWKKISFMGGQTYGFQTKISVPNVSPATSSNAFFVEVGFNNDAINDRLMGAMIPAKEVKALTGCIVSYASNLMSFSANYLEFQFNIATSLYENDGVVIKGDANTAGIIMVCNPLVLSGSTALASDIKCDTQSDKDGLPKVTLKVAATPMLAGYYAFELRALNPNTKVLTAGSWTFGTYSNVMEYPASPAIDRALVAPGFPINGPMLDAGFVPTSLEQRLLTLRNDRPSKENQLIFRFKLYNPPPDASSMMELRGPRGFEFAEDCLSSVETSKNTVFGPNTASTWPADYVEWPLQATPTACAGDGRFATLTIPAGLQHEKMYVFRIGVLKNPVATPSWNKWTIAFATESYLPIDGFMVWTFTETEVSAVSSAKSPTGGNVAKSKIPVTIHFRPFNRIPSGGFMRLEAPAGFELVQESGACYQPILMDKGGLSVFTTVDFSCEVKGDTKLLVQLIGNKPIEAGRDYTLILHVYNPTSPTSAGHWRLESLGATGVSSQGEAALDEASIPGHAINNIVNAWTVSNKFNLTNGKTKLNDVEFSMQFPEELKNGDEILVQGPQGFNLQGNPDIFECNTFRWNKKPAPLPNSGDPLCFCTESVCTIRFTVSEVVTPAYPENRNLQFAIATENPARTPFLTENFWKVSHHRGKAVLSSDVFPSWGINSQLEDVQIQLVGVNQGAGMMSDISLALTPVNNADTIMIEALSPSNFDFGKATVLLPYMIDPSSANDVVIINRCSIIAGRRLTVRINSVKLGNGGQTKFNLYTYLDETRAVKMDEQLEYSGGFRLPGKITIAGKELKNKYKEERSLHPVKSLFQARVAELAKAEFTLLFSQPASAGQKLRIICQGEGAYQLKANPFMIIEKGLLDSSRQCTSPDWSQGGQVQTSVSSTANSAGIIATLMPGRPSSDVAIKSDTPYLVVMQVVPNQGTNTWLFETTDGGQYPTNTNDGMTSGFLPVEQMSLQVQVARSPPKAFIEVTLDVKPGTAPVKKLMVIAPPHFIFPPKCGDMCTAGQALGFTGRRTAAIASPSGQPLTTFTGLRIQVQTPDKTPDSVTWFVEGRGVSGMTTGWAEAGNEFQVVQMSNSKVWYPGVAGLSGTEITFRFTLAVDAGSQSQIIVESPFGYSLRCTSAGALKPISLPSAPTCTENPLRLTIDNSLVAGTYAFGAVVDVPLEKPKPNTFNIIVRGNDNKVKDSAYNLPGFEIYPLPLESPTFSWTSAEPGKVSTITIGLAFTGSVDTLKALLITFPENLEHAVQKPTNVKNQNVRFPVALTYPGGWADYLQKDKIKILLDNSAPTVTISADKYAWSFPVIMPSGAPPKENVWFLVLCSSATCEEPGGPGSLVTFPIAGFNPTT